MKITLLLLGKYPHAGVGTPGKYEGRGGGGDPKVELNPKPKKYRF